MEKRWDQQESEVFMTSKTLGLHNHGKELYIAFIEKATEYSRSYGGVFVGAHYCTIGSTSDDAKRVWASITKNYTSSGDVIFIGT